MAQPSKTPLQWTDPRGMSGARWNQVHLARVRLSVWGWDLSNGLTLTRGRPRMSREPTLPQNRDQVPGGITALTRGREGRDALLMSRNTPACFKGEESRSDVADGVVMKQRSHAWAACGSG